MNARRASGIERLVGVVRDRLGEGKQVRRTLEPWGRLAVDRPLPFLVVYRRPKAPADNATFRLVTSEASYLTCVADRRHRDDVGRLVETVARVQGGRFGAFLLLELWAGDRGPLADEVDGAPKRPTFRIFAPRTDRHEWLADSLEDALRKVKLNRRRAAVRTVESARQWPRRLSSVLPRERASELGCISLGIEVAPTYLDPATGEPYPRLLGQLRRKLSVALRRFFFDFVRTSTTADPAHFHVLGRRGVVKAVWEVDGLLDEASESFEFLLQLTPVNGEQAWRQFVRSKHQRRPALHYRPLPVEPVVLKRQLFKAPVERIEDPALALIFRQKLNEIDRQITMLEDRNSERFLHESIQLFGAVEDDLHDLAIDLLERIPARSREGSKATACGADAFAARAREEIEFLRGQHPEIQAGVQVRSDVTGLLVSRGNLLVSAHSQIPAARVEALVQHEVGTHVLTYHNGRAQRFRLLASGLAGYDSLQEGLAVLAEYLVGGLNAPRLRLLAGRVVAARCLVDGASFVDTFRVLHHEHGFAGRIAFTITVRTHRSGGLTKDAVYLRGLRQILEYLARGGELAPLYVGKIAVEHISIIRELTWRGVLLPPPMTPRYLDDPDAQARLIDLRQGRTVVDLLQRRKR